MARMAGALFALIGLALLAGAVAQGVSTRRFLTSAVRAPGVVTRLNAGGSHPQVQFTAASGQRVSYPQGGMIFGYRASEPVAVLYDPHRPAQTACLNAPGALWGDVWGLSLLGAAFFGVGLARALGSKAVSVRGLEP